LIIKNDSPSAWALVEYSFKLENPMFRIKSDPNAGIVKDVVLNKNQDLHMLLELEIDPEKVAQGAGNTSATTTEPCPVTLKLVHTNPLGSGAGAARPLPPIESTYSMSFYIPQTLLVAKYEFPPTSRVGTPMEVTVRLTPTEAGRSVLSSVAPPTYTLSVSRRTLTKNNAIYLTVVLPEDQDAQTWAIIGPKRVMVNCNVRYPV
jgi:hypothetical protein